LIGHATVQNPFETKRFRLVGEKHVVFNCRHSRLREDVKRVQRSVVQADVSMDVDGADLELVEVLFVSCQIEELDDGVETPQSFLEIGLRKTDRVSLLAVAEEQQPVQVLDDSFRPKVRTFHFGNKHTVAFEHLLQLHQICGVPLRNDALPGTHLRDQRLQLGETLVVVDLAHLELQLRGVDARHRHHLPFHDARPHHVITKRDRGVLEQDFLELGEIPRRAFVLHVPFVDLVGGSFHVHLHPVLLDQEQLPDEPLELGLAQHHVRQLGVLPHVLDDVSSEAGGMAGVFAVQGVVLAVVEKSQSGRRFLEKSPIRTSAARYGAQVMFVEKFVERDSTSDFFDEPVSFIASSCNSFDRKQAIAMHLTHLNRT
jgi:hypothetical protein